MPLKGDIIHCHIEGQKSSGNIQPLPFTCAG